MARFEQFTVGELIKDGIGGSALHVTERDRNFNVSECEGTSIPSDAGSDYAIGCVFTKTDAVLGQCPKWVNMGTTSSCKFRPVGPVIGYGFAAGGGPIASVGSDTAETISLPGLANNADIAVVGIETTDDNDQIVAAKAADGEIAITASADPSTAHAYNFGLLREMCVPGYDVVAAGTYDAVADDDATVAITVSGVLATDIAFAIHTDSDDSDTLNGVVCTEDTVTITVSADPGTAHSYAYVVLRPRGDFQPSHYVAYAGIHTTVGGDTSEEITVTGALATDIPLVGFHTTDDTDNIVKSVIAADKITVTLSANPGDTHKLWYVVLRAY